MSGTPQPIGSGPKPVGTPAATPVRTARGPAPVGAPKPAEPRPKRMTLASVVNTKHETPHRIIIYGKAGIGKSTFAADAPAPIFLGTEDGLAEIDAKKYPDPECWDDILDAIDDLTQSEHQYKTLAIDTLDWAEPLLWDHVCKLAQKKTIEGFGYGKGYTAALEHWRIFLHRLSTLQEKRKMNVILVAHAQVKTYKNPEDEDYDRSIGKLHEKAWGLCVEWAKDVLFASVKSYAHINEDTKRVRGVTAGERIIRTQYAAAYDAKNRHNLEPELPLDWNTFTAACAAAKGENQ